MRRRLIGVGPPACQGVSVGTGKGGFVLPGVAMKAVVVSAPWRRCHGRALAVDCPLAPPNGVFCTTPEDWGSCSPNPESAEEVPVRSLIRLFSSWLSSAPPSRPSGVAAAAVCPSAPRWIVKVAAEVLVRKEPWDAVSMTPSVPWGSLG